MRHRAEVFRALHQGPGAFIIPNPWDIGTARILAAMGFSALATTSAGMAFSLGRPEGQVSRDDTLSHCGQIVEATPLPVSADLEKGFGDTPDPHHDIDRLRQCRANHPDLLQILQSWCVEHVRSGGFERLQPPDGVIEIGAIPQVILAPGRQNEVVRERTARLRGCLDPLDRQGEIINRIIRPPGVILDGATGQPDACSRSNRFGDAVIGLLTRRAAGLNMPPVRGVSRTGAEMA